MIRKWSEDVRAYYAIARTPREGRTAKALSRSDLFPDRKVDHALMDIVATMEPQQLDVVFRGGDVTIDGSRLSGEAAQKLEAGHPAVPGGKTFAAAFWTSWNQLNAGPVLWVRSSSGVSQSIMGGVIWDSNWFQAAGEGWHYTGAAETQAFLISRARREPNLGEPGPVLTLPAWMRNAAEKQDLNLIADSVYPRGNSRGGSSWIGRTPEQTMAALSLDGEMTWKKAGAFYLLRDKSAEAHPRPHLVTWSDIRSLREDSEANGGYLSFNSLLRLSEKSGPQLDGLSEEFPTAEGDVIADWLPVFHFYANLDPSAQRKLLSKEGLPLGEAGLLARNTLAEAGDRTGVRGLALLDKDPRHAVLALIRATDDSGERGHTLTWRITIPDVPPHDLRLKLVPRRPLVPE
jgi:hypothetical protein